MRILVVGSGAMGTLFAGLLAAGYHDVAILGRRPVVVDAITRGGVTVVRDGMETSVRVRATTNARQLGIADLVILFVKSYSTARACMDMLPALGKDTLVLTPQNGLGNVEVISGIVGPDRVLPAVTSHGATLMGPGRVLHAGVGETIIGEMSGKISDRLQRIGDAFRQAGIEVELSTQVDVLLWGKLMVNAAINPITALLGVKNGELLRHPETRALMSELAREVVHVAHAKGVDLSSDNLAGKVEEVCRLTAENRSSMLQDMDRGTLTEVDYINGAVVREGELVDVLTPMNWVVANLVRGRERQLRLQRALAVIPQPSG